MGYSLPKTQVGSGFSEGVPRSLHWTPLGVLPHKIPLSNPSQAKVNPKMTSASVQNILLGWVEESLV